MSMLPEAIQRSADGHLSELALSALADGQAEVLSATTHLHVDECEVCQLRFADAVLEHAMAAEAALGMQQRLAVPSKAPWGWIVVAAALTLGVRGAELLDTVGRHGVVRHVAHARRASALVARSLLAESSWMVTTCALAAAVVLVAVLAKWVAPPRERV